MPYTIRRQGGKRPWKIIKRDTGEVVGSSVSKEAAESSMRARMAGDHGWKGTKKKK